jgi:NADPH-dependent glutamate synthase beta subunit-like oxidoreductase
MKRPKDRLHRVAVIGATPSGIAAANKLDELGIPVTLIDTDHDIDKKLSNESWRLPSGIPLNYAYRSSLIKIFRNSNIHCILPAKVNAIKHNAQGFRIKITKMQTFVDADKCTLCGRCVASCPVVDVKGEKAVRMESRRSLPGRPLIDKRQMPPCQQNCPLGVNVQGYIALTHAGKFAEALELIRKDNILPGICGRICTHPCEDVCRRKDIDEAVAIRDIKRFLSDYEREQSHTKTTKQQYFSPTGKKVAVIGSGPSGLAAAGDLARMGCQVTVFEKEKKPGGMLAYGIGHHRLPVEILDVEIEHIKTLGVTFKNNHKISFTKDMQTLSNEFDAVILATGIWTDIKLGIPGEESKDVEGCLSFLKKLNRGEIKKIKKNVAVIGDGNAAFDLARTLIRLGADVTILSWFPHHLIPADSDEIKGALDEGVVIKDSTKTIEFIEKNGKLDHLRCMPTLTGDPDVQGNLWPVINNEGEPFELKFDMAFVAIGQKSLLSPDSFNNRVELTDQGLIQVDKFGRTSLSKFYASGDIVSGPSSVVKAMASGRLVAKQVCSDILGNNNSHKDYYQRPERPLNKDFEEIPEDINTTTRLSMPERQPVVRRESFSEVTIGLSSPQTHTESERCLQCGICSECLQCVDVCGTTGAINHHETASEIVEHAGVVIIADPEMAPMVKGEDIIRAYGPKAAKLDVVSMLMRGYASAAHAMLLLGGAYRNLKGNGISFSQPDSGLSPDIRIGIFACRCKDALGWLDEMTEYITRLTCQEDVVCSQVMTSACTPEGYSGILRTIREKGITRVVLATCVCCPLNHICSSCTDQRSRLKDALFKGSAVSRSMVETCNLRGEVLNLIQHDTDLALSRFTGLISRSVKRARKLKLLPAPARLYNFTTAVIGNSEATCTSAMTLANAGMDVFLFQHAETPSNDLLDHLNIHQFKGYLIKSIKGSLGNFQIFVEFGGFHQTLQVGAIILGEKSRKSIQYIYQEGLPSRVITPFMQKKGVHGIPFFYPGATAIAGLFLSDPPEIYISNRKKGLAAAAHAAAVMPSGPRQSRGFTVVIDENLCRGCGRCLIHCPYQAVTLNKNVINGWCASVDEAICNGCGNCTSVCPSNAADSPYRHQAFLEKSLEEILEGKNGSA